MNYHTFNELRDAAHAAMRNESSLVHPSHWQARDVSKKPEMATHEVVNFFGQCYIPQDHATLVQETQPSMPWAFDHFAERMCGMPVNPGSTWKSWPYALSASSFRQQGKFNHNYMERFWPRKAGLFQFETETAEQYEGMIAGLGGAEDSQGIYHRYGDWEDVIDLFCKDMLTRQAYVPVFFPEDTGSHHGGRVPCTLGYHFMIRNGKMNVSYFMRSCDLKRHFNDDCYLTARLVYWLLDRLTQKAPDRFGHISPGTFAVFISSLHIFRNDWYALYGDTPHAGTDQTLGRVAGADFTAIEQRVLDHAQYPYSHGGQQVSRSVADVGSSPTGRLSHDTSLPHVRERPFPKHVKFIGGGGPSVNPSGGTGGGTTRVTSHARVRDDGGEPTDD